ncbi:hypothetical protein Pmar_PMAR020066 [Perkinsus marinus ATCC 50983]|uniref:SH3 domain-containing protein n=1 Tax=Perkinsus marinus (strain ATCC 50983 / TXsc) TaxID=423536 RepID=C5KWL2_PERM5|nr:hypothetical protein Pmar_PMAR020066 [Perkinsus marinus ATCC 50983]EER11087.1 hypothetical protein Pmar_PMAR020066 [Perkinsus marinus ATCC 50983]|eukprot:XP_002779292.1 hypothetical protein Pmar_PMAR020066 [Perkinsus marinus ATCC 50983]
MVVFSSRGGNSVPVAPKGSAPSPIINGYSEWKGRRENCGEGGDDKGSRGTFDDGKGAYKGGKGKGSCREDLNLGDGHPEERTRGNATDLLPMFQDQGTSSHGKASGQRQAQACAPYTQGIGKELLAGKGLALDQQPSLEHLKQEWTMLQHKLEQQRNEGRDLMLNAVVGPEEGLTRERHVEGDSPQQQQQPEGYEDTYPDQYPRGQPEGRGYQGDVRSPLTGHVGMASLRGVMQHPDGQGYGQEQGQVAQQAPPQEPRSLIIGYEHMVGAGMNRGQEQPVGRSKVAESRLTMQGNINNNNNNNNNNLKLIMMSTWFPMLAMMATREGRQGHFGRIPSGDLNVVVVVCVPREGKTLDLTLVEPSVNLRKMRDNESRQQHDGAYYYSEDLVDDPTRREPHWVESRRWSDRDRLPAESRYDTQRPGDGSVRWAHEGRTYRDDIQQVRESRDRFTKSRSAPWYVRPVLGHREMPKFWFEATERRIVFLDDAEQVVSIPFDLPIENPYRGLTKGDVGKMSVKELRALRAERQQERLRLDESRQEMLWGLEGLDRPAPWRSAQDDLISFDRKSASSSDHGQRYNATTPVLTPDDRDMLPGPPSPPRSMGPPLMDSVSSLCSPHVEALRSIQQWEDDRQADSVPDGCCPMCHAKFPDEGRTICSQVRDVAELDSLQQHAENCNDQCPERTEGPGSRPGVGHPVMVKSSYTPDLGEHDNQLSVGVGDEVLLTELDEDNCGWTLVNKDGIVGWVPTAVLDLEPPRRLRPILQWYVRGIQFIVGGKEERELDSYQKEQSRQLIRRAEETACAIASNGGQQNDEVLERIRGMVLRIPNTLAMLTVDWENPFYIANSLLAVVRGYIQGKFGQYEGIRDVKKSLKNTRAFHRFIEGCGVLKRWYAIDLRLWTIVLHAYGDRMVTNIKITVQEEASALAADYSPEVLKEKTPIHERIKMVLKSDQNEVSSSSQSNLDGDSFVKVINELGAWCIVPEIDFVHRFGKKGDSWSRLRTSLMPLLKRVEHGSAFQKRCVLYLIKQHMFEHNSRKKGAVSGKDRSNAIEPSQKDVEQACIAFNFDITEMSSPDDPSEFRTDDVDQFYSKLRRGWMLDMIASFNMTADDIIDFFGDDEKLLRGAFNKYGHMGDAASQAQLLLANSELRRAVGRDVGENPALEYYLSIMKYGCGDPGNYQDVFGPLSEECDETNDKYFWLPMYIDPPGVDMDDLSSPDAYAVHMIESIHRLRELEEILTTFQPGESPYRSIAFDVFFRCDISLFLERPAPAIIGIATSTKVFLIMVNRIISTDQSFNGSEGPKAIRQFLTSVLCHPNILKVVYGINAANYAKLVVLQHVLVEEKFSDDVREDGVVIQPLFDVSAGYPNPLHVEVRENLAGIRLCVAEEMSNWDRRPFLRYSQLHYAASRLWLIYMLYLTVPCDKVEKKYIQQIDTAEVYVSGCDSRGYSRNSPSLTTPADLDDGVTVASWMAHHNEELRQCRKRYDSMRGERIRENRQRWEEDEKILRGEDYLDATAVGDEATCPSSSRYSYTSDLSASVTEESGPRADLRRSRRSNVRGQQRVRYSEALKRQMAVERSVQPVIRHPDATPWGSPETAQCKAGNSEGVAFMRAVFTYSKCLAKE